MSILFAGSFRVSDYRKPIPAWVQIVCAIRALDKLSPLGGEDLGLVRWVRSLRMDHRPPLQDRDYNTEIGDFIPGQNDPDYIEAIPARAHDERTFGRKADAEKTVTTRDSDIGEASRARKIRDSQALHRAKMAMKSGDPQAVAEALGAVKQKSRLRPRRKIPSRPFPTRRSANAKERLSRSRD